MNFSRQIQTYIDFWFFLLSRFFYGFLFFLTGENGFNQAIELAAESLANVKFIQEKKLINSYFDQISQDTGKYCFGVEDTLRALEMGAVETLICWENLDIQRYSLKNHTSGKQNSVKKKNHDSTDENPGNSSTNSRFYVKLRNSCFHFSLSRIFLLFKNRIL